MNYEIITQLQFFGISVLSGALILLVYDVLRIFRRLVKQGTFVLAIQDIIFWTIAGVFIFVIIYKENNGIIRGYCVMGMTVGMLLYHFIISQTLVNTVTELIKILLTPIVMAIKAVKRFLRFLCSKINKLLKFTISQLKKPLKSVRITLDAKRKANADKRRAKISKKQAALQKKKDEAQAKKQKQENKNTNRKKDTDQKQQTNQKTLKDKNKDKANRRA